MACLASFLFFAFIFAFPFFEKWFNAAITILTFDKAGLRDFGNLCDSTPPPPIPPYHKWQRPTDDWLHH